ncbi:MAG: TolC family protein, partial [Desulfobacterales bacterium]
VQISLISEVVSTYFLLLDYHQRLKISEKTLVSRLQSLDIIQKRFDKGVIPEIDLNQAQIQKEIAEGAIPLYRRLIANTENALSILMGKFPGEIKTGDDLDQQTVPPDIPVGLPSSILERRPDIAEAMYLLQAQTARIGVAQALRFPSISLTGLFGVASSEISSISTDGTVWSVGGSLLGPVFDFKKSRQRVEIENERTQQALYRYENRVLFAFREVSDALNDIQTYKTQISTVERKLKAAENAARLSKMRYDKGVTSYLEVLDTERTLFDVGLEYSELKQQFYNAYVRLYKALGGGWLTKAEMEQTQPQPEAQKKQP